jgi:PAS domain-containing protein
LLWSPARYLLVSVWLVWLLALVALRVIQVAAFDSATPSRQARPNWRRMFLAGSAFSGLTLASAAIALVPVDNFEQQAWVFGLIGTAALSASVAYAVSLPAFLSFALPCLLPPTLFLFAYDAGHQRGWGWLGLILLGALMVVAWQVNRLIERGLLRRFQNQALIEHLQSAQRHAEDLNHQLSAEVRQRRQAEDELRLAHGGLEQRVAQRSHELDLANQALSKSEQRLALALQASELGLWDWNLESDEVHHTQLHALFGLDADQVRSVRADLKPRLHPDDLPLLRRTWSSTSRGAPRITGSSTGYAMCRATGAGSRTAAGRWSAMSTARSCACSAPVVTSPRTRSRKNSNAWQPRYSRPPAKASRSSTQASSCWRSTRRSATLPATAVPS